MAVSNSFSMKGGQEEARQKKGSRRERRDLNESTSDG
jgi:hypothetical protein